MKFGKTSKRIAIRSDELRSAAEIERELSKLHVEKQDLDKKNTSLHERCDELYQSLLEAEEFRRASDQKLKEAYSDIESLKKENVHLWEYFDRISEQEGFKNCGKKSTRLRKATKTKNTRTENVCR